MEIMLLTKSILCSNFLSISSSLYLGKEAKWTDSSEVKFWYISSETYGTIGAIILHKLVNTSYKGKKFYIIDDIYATGNTVKAISDAVKKLGGKVVGAGVLINIKELNNNKKLFSIIDVNESE